jgi:hypothetical protein
VLYFKYSKAKERLKMQVKVEINNYYALKDMCWCNEENFNKIERYGLEDEFFAYIDSLFEDDIYADTTINDAIIFDETGLIT